MAEASEPRALRRLLLEVLVFVLVLGSIDTAVRRFATRRFNPFTKVHAAMASGDGCVVFTGGSDMESATDAVALTRALVGPGGRTCITDLTLGGTLKDVRFMAFREYVGAGRKPAELVIGFKGYDAADEQADTPGYYVGSNAAVYAWGHASDLATYFPSFSFDAANNSLRFLLYKITALGAYRQAFWERLAMTEERIGMKQPNPINSFGYVKEFIALDETNRRLALRKHKTGNVAWHLTRFTTEFVAAAERAGVRAVHFVRLPALAATEAAYFGDAVAERSFDDFMQRTARAHGGKYINLAHEPWVDDSLLIDGLHYAPRGRQLIGDAMIESLRAATP